MVTGGSTSLEGGQERNSENGGTAASSEVTATPRLRILHLTECFEGGVGHAIRTAVDLTPQHVHFLLGAGEEYNSANMTSGFAGKEALPKPLVARTLAIRNTVTRLDIDVIHAHSSWAGVYARARNPGVPVIYQPHCYAVEMAGPAKTVLFSIVEHLLGRRADTVAVLSLREETLASRFSPTARLVRLPNAPTVPIKTALRETKHTSHRVGMAGRIARQKNPSFFRDVALGVKAVDPTVEFVWIGDGDEAGRCLLEDAGVKVTGWLDRDGMTCALDALDLYVHTADYEGFPLSVLDAAARGVPVLARDIPAFDGSEVMQVNGLQDLVALVLKAACDLDFDEELRQRSKLILASRNETNQKRALGELYGEFV